ncbi:MAG: tyrosine--tRNA ligase [Chloroflexi bacterium]|nr:tyrosine--tRNA ligase [Chloroflexota bacterium]
MLKRGVAEIIVEEEFIRLLESGRPLRLKQGFDPSRPDIHLGHVVGLRKLRQLQEVGHQVILIVGDWTAQIGDPSGASVTRPMLSAEEVKANAETYMRQFFKVVDKTKTQVRWQTDWFGKFDLSDVIKLTSKFTVAQMLARDDFANRYSAGKPIAITELLYPLLQAHDSVMIEADVEFGGTDQRFNCLVGRQLQAIVGQTSQQVFLMPLLVGTDGVQKMSKSLGNYIAVDEPPSEMYGKVMSLPDALILDYFELLTDVPDEELEEFRLQMASQSINPMLLKKRLAREIVAQFHSAEAAEEADGRFERLFQRREMVAEEVREVSASKLTRRIADRSSSGVGSLPTGQKFTIGAAELAGFLVEEGLAESRGAAKRLIAGGTVTVDGQRVSGKASVGDGTIIRVGGKRRQFFRVVSGGPPDNR